MKGNLVRSAILSVCFVATPLLDVHAQRVDSPAQTSAFVAVDRFDWYVQSEAGEPRFGKNSYGQGQPEGKSANLPNADLSESAKSEKFVYRIRIRNLTDREISRVVWRYQFFNPLTGALAASLEFISDVRIKPDRRKTLVVESLSRPAPTIDVRLLEFNRKRPFRETAVVEAVVFGTAPEKKKGEKKHRPQKDSSKK